MSEVVNLTNVNIIESVKKFQNYVLEITDLAYKFSEVFEKNNNTVDSYNNLVTYTDNLVNYIHELTELTELTKSNEPTELTKLTELTNLDYYNYYNEEKINLELIDLFNSLDQSNLTSNEIYYPNLIIELIKINTYILINHIKSINDITNLDLYKITAMKFNCVSMTYIAYFAVNMFNNLNSINSINSIRLIITVTKFCINLKKKAMIALNSEITTEEFNIKLSDEIYKVIDLAN
jgi:hypothetical protein